MGVFWVFGTTPPFSLHHYRPPTCQTQKTRPWGRVFRVWHVTHIPPRLEQQNEPTRARSVVRVPSPRLEHQNTPTRACSDVRACPLLSRTALSLSPPVLEHQNAPLWARSAVRARLLTVSSSRTSPHGLVLLFGHVPPVSNTRTSPGARSAVRARSPRLEHHNAHSLPVSNSRTSPCGLVLMFGHVPSPFPRLKHQNAPSWARSCVRSCPPRLQQEKHALSGVFLLSGTHTHPPVLFGMPLPFPLSRKPQICPDR